MTPEQIKSQRSEAQREFELAWIDNNSPLFSTKALGYFGLVGRGAIIVDAAAKHLGEGVLFTYLSKEQMEHIANTEVSQMVDVYDPANEFVVLLLLPQDEIRAYRVGTTEEQGLETESSSGISYVRT